MIAAVRMSARTTPVMTLILNAGIVAALWIGGKQVDVGGMKVGELVAFISYLMQALNSLMMFSNLIIQVSRAQASARRVGELLDSKPALKPPVLGVRIVQPKGRVVFENVSFSYSTSGKEPVLKNISFVAEPGQTVALLGATGSGKSSLVQSIPRFYDVMRGRVTLDGIDVREIPEDELRRHIGIALQESILFSTTIRNNIAMGEPGASFERIVEAAQQAQADGFITHFPEGYDTLVGQRGVNLSGGQKQRIAIARALLPRPSVLILDDSTSAVDLQTEAGIQEAMSRQHFTQTRILVAQRVSAVLNADKILVLDKGEIAGSGSHLKLLETCAVYREIYESQTEKGILVHHGN
jgi:ATP-binding cassette subfamily B protein